LVKEIKMATKIQMNEILSAYRKELGYEPMHWPKERTAASKIINAGYTVDQAIRLYREMKADKFWADQHLSLMSVATRLPAWTLANKERTVTDDDLNRWFEENN
jgi:hypothetical protein